MATGELKDCKMTFGLRDKQETGAKNCVIICHGISYGKDKSYILTSYDPLGRYLKTNDENVTMDLYAVGKKGDSSENSKKSINEFEECILTIYMGTVGNPNLYTYKGKISADFLDIMGDLVFRSGDAEGLWADCPRYNWAPCPVL